MEQAWWGSHITRHGVVVVECGSSHGRTAVWMGKRLGSIQRAYQCGCGVGSVFFCSAYTLETALIS